MPASLPRDARRAIVRDHQPETEAGSGMRVPRATLLALTRQPADGSADPAYWRLACEGFQVWGPNGRVGVVAEVLPGASPDEARLVVAGGLFRRRSVTIPVELVAEVQPDRKRIVLSALPQPARGATPDVVSAAKPIRAPEAEGGSPL
jgi:hypothetical protein